MAYWEEIVCKAKELTEAAGKKASEIAESAKLELRFAEIQREMEECHKALGRLLYESWSTGDELVNSEVAPYVVRLDKLEADKMTVLRDLHRMHNTNVCSRCRYKNSKHARYCSHCGKKL